MKKENGETKVVHFVKNCKFEDIPTPTIEKAKLALLDAVGATISGTIADICDISLKFASHAMKGDEATALTYGKKLSASGAAFVNANAANALDSDDDNTLVKGHVGAQLIPTALAVAEKMNASGKELLEAIVIGYEVAFRIGAAWHRHNNIWRAGGSWGSVSNGVTAAKLMGLDHSQIMHTIGIAEYHAPLIPIDRDLQNPAMVKHGMGWGAMNGIMSAEMAELGYTGVPSILGFDEYDDIVSGIGENYLMVSVLGFKEFPAVAYSHPPRYCIKKLRETESFDAADIEKVIIESFHNVIAFPQQVPTNTEEAQFNVLWPVACEIAYGDFLPKHQLKESFSDEIIKSSWNKIELVEDVEFNRLYDLMEDHHKDGKFCCRTTIHLKNGKKLTEEYAIKSFGHKLTKEQLSEKFHNLCDSVYSKAKNEKIIETILNVEQLDTVRALITLIG